MDSMTDQFQLGRPSAMIAGMLDHLSIQCADVEASAEFYDRVLSAVGGQRIMEFPGVIGYGVPVSYTHLTLPTSDLV